MKVHFIKTAPELLQLTYKYIYIYKLCEEKICGANTKHNKTMQNTDNWIVKRREKNQQINESLILWSIKQMKIKQLISQFLCIMEILLV